MTLETQDGNGTEVGTGNEDDGGEVLHDEGFTTGWRWVT